MKMDKGIESWFGIYSIKRKADYKYLWMEGGYNRIRTKLVGKSKS